MKDHYLGDLHELIPQLKNHIPTPTMMELINNSMKISKLRICGIDTVSSGCGMLSYKVPNHETPPTPRIIIPIIIRPIPIIFSPSYSIHLIYLKRTVCLTYDFDKNRNTVNMFANVPIIDRLKNFRYAP